MLVLVHSEVEGSQRLGRSINHTNDNSNRIDSKSRGTEGNWRPRILTLFDAFVDTRCETKLLYARGFLAEEYRRLWARYETGFAVVMAAP